jgi:hypothetical protein
MDPASKGLAANRHLSFLHRFEQGGLCLGRRAVDFVGKQDAGEDRPFDETETASARFVFLQDLGARDVRWHEVRRKLNSLERNVENVGKRADHQRLCQPWNAFEQAMSSREDRCQQLFNHIVLAHNDFRKFRAHGLLMLSKFAQHVAEVARLRGRCLRRWRSTRRPRVCRVPDQWAVAKGRAGSCLSSLCLC